MLCNGSPRPWARGAFVLALTLSPTLGCDGDRGAITLHVQHADGTPAHGIEITAVPFDLEALLDSLKDVAPTPAPDFSALEAELARYQPDSADDARRRVDGPWIALRDSAMRLSDSLFAMDRTDPAYAPAYERFRAMYRRLTRETTARDRMLRDLGAGELDLARRAQAAADSLRQWEITAFEDYDALVARAVQRTGRQPVVARTDEDGLVVFELDAGQWWFHARETDPDNPFMEYRWRGTAIVFDWLPFRIPLGAGSVERVWRH